MKLPRIAATAAAAAAFAFLGTVAHAQAQNPTDTSHPVDQNTLTSVGGSPGPQTAMGAGTGETRQQVYRELIDSQHDGEAQRTHDLYNGRK
jgi:hypothetical protein